MIVTKKTEKGNFNSFITKNEIKVIWTCLHLKPKLFKGGIFRIDYCGPKI